METANRPLQADSQVCISLTGRAFLPGKAAAEMLVKVQGEMVGMLVKGEGRKNGMLVKGKGGMVGMQIQQIFSRVERPGESNQHVACCRVLAKTVCTSPAS